MGYRDQRLSPFQTYFQKFITPISEWDVIKYACAELFGPTDSSDLVAAGRKWADEIERLVNKLRFESKLENAGELRLAEVEPHVNALLGKTKTASLSTMPDAITSRDHLLPFRPVCFRGEYMSDDLFIASSFALAFVTSATLMQSRLHWHGRNRQCHAGLIANASTFIWNMALRCQEAIRPVSHMLTAVRLNGPFHIGDFSEENAHWAAYRIGIAATTRLNEGLPIEIRFDFDDDPSRLKSAILESWDACREAMTTWNMPARNKVEAEIVWETRRAEDRREGNLPDGKPMVESGTPAKKRSVEPPDVHRFVSPRANGYYRRICVSGPVSNYKGLQDIETSQSPCKPVMVVLDGILHADVHSQAAMGKEELKGHDELRELMANRDKAKKNNDLPMTQQLTEEIDTLTKQLESSTGVFKKQRDINNPYDKLRPKIHKRIKDACDKLRQAQPPMKELAEHFQLSISSEGGDAFIYRPAGTLPDWKFHLPPNK